MDKKTHQGSDSVMIVLRAPFVSSVVNDFRTLSAPATQLPAATHAVYTSNLLCDDQSCSSHLRS